MILVVSWAMMLNIAQLIRNRMTMQNEADNIALSIATHKARVMNCVGGYNYLIGTILAIGTKPIIVQLPSYRTDLVASYIYGDYKSNVINKPLDRDVSHMKKMVNILQQAQEKIMQNHIVYQSVLVAECLSKGYLLKVSPSAIPTKESSEKYFGLRRNAKSTRYLKTINTSSKLIPHFVYNPEIGTEIEGLYGDFQTRNVHGRDKYSWYITGENFHKQKIKVMLSKLENGNSKPLFARLLGIKYPSITVFSAAAIYNTKGTMFPKQETEFTGFPPTSIAIAINAATLAQMSGVTAECAKISKAFAATVEACMLASFAYSLYQGGIGQDNSPIKNYQDSKDGGWAAHLIPY